MELGKPFSLPLSSTRSQFWNAVRYIPDVVDLAADPTRPSSWARLLLGKPLDALINWYRRRPVAKLIRTAKTVASLEHYERLLSKHLGQDISQETLTLQRSRVDAIT